jgi:hypothetical protein
VTLRDLPGLFFVGQLTFTPTVIDRVVLYVLARAARRHAALLDAFEIRYVDGAFYAPSSFSEWPWRIVDAITQESLALFADEIADSGDMQALIARPLPQAESALRWSYNQLLENKTVQVLGLPVEELQPQAARLYATHTQAALQEVELLLTLFPERTHELAHYYAQVRSLGDEAKMEVLRTLIAPEMLRLHGELTRLEESTDEASWPFSKLKEPSA